MVATISVHSLHRSVLEIFFHREALALGMYLDSKVLDLLTNLEHVFVGLY